MRVFVLFTLILCFSLEGWSQPSPEQFPVQDSIFIRQNPEVPVVEEEVVPNKENAVFSSDPLLKESVEKVLTEQLLNRKQYYSYVHVRDFYQCKDFENVWVNRNGVTRAGSELMNVIRKAHYYGLDPEYYNYQSLQDKINLLSNLSDDEIAATDILLTDTWFKLATHLRFGLLEPEKGNEVNKIYNFEDNISDYLDISLLLEDVEGQLLALQPQQTAYKRLIKGLQNWLDHQTLTSNSFIIPETKDSILRYQAAANVLQAYHYLDADSLPADSIIVDALKQFQVDHGLNADGLIGKNTIKALELSNAQRYARVALNIEKWKWEKSWDEHHIYVNLPSYHVEVFDKGKTIKKHRAIIGATKHKTPLITSQLEYFILNPYWNVPYSIAVNEILPKVKRDPGYLARNGMKVISGGKILNPTKINWTQYGYGNFPYRFRQDGGDINALGMVKFRFPNNQAIFLHDTQNKTLFNKDLRAFSHGCIRLENPLEFAEFLTSYDQNTFNEDSIALSIADYERVKVDLNKEVDIYLRYFTADGTNDGGLIFHYDIYGRHKKLRKFFERKTERIFASLNSL